MLVLPPPPGGPEEQQRLTLSTLVGLLALPPVQLVFAGVFVLDGLT